MLSLAETKVLDISLPCIVGYNLCRNDRSNKGGGVAIYVKANLKSKLYFLLLEQDDCIETLSVSIQLSYFKSIVVTSLYRPKFTLNTNDINSREAILTKQLAMNKPFYLCGDYNIHFENKSNPIIMKFLNMLDVLNVSASIQEPTRQTSTIDNILTNDCDSITFKGILNPEISDHNACFIVRNCEKSKLEKKTVLRRNYEAINFEYLGNLVINTNFACEGDLDCKIQHFIQTHINIYDEVAPMKTITFVKK